MKYTRASKAAAHSPENLVKNSPKEMALSPPDTIHTKD